MCWAHVDDIARGHLLAMERGEPGKIYIIAGEGRELAGLFDLAQEITGIPAPIKVPPGMLRMMSNIMKVTESLVPVPEMFTSEGLRVVAGVTYLGDNSKARRELGYNPRPLREGLEQTLRHEMSLLGMK